MDKLFQVYNIFRCTKGTFAHWRTLPVGIAKRYFSERYYANIRAIEVESFLGGYGWSWVFEKGGYLIVIADNEKELLKTTSAKKVVKLFINKKEKYYGNV